MPCPSTAGWWSASPAAKFAFGNIPLDVDLYQSNEDHEQEDDGLEREGGEAPSKGPADPADHPPAQHHLVLFAASTKSIFTNK